MAYRLQDLIDIPQLQILQDRLNEIYSFPASLIDNEGNVLTATAWQEICTRFHRKHPDCERECIKSDQYILSHLEEANPAVTYRCPHGLVDNATPIIIESVHYGNYFTGQFFLEEPDMEFFRSQARKFGFDEEDYLSAVKKVPVWTQDQLNHYLFFIKGLITILCESGLKKMREIESRRKIALFEKRADTISRVALDGFCCLDMQGRLLEANEALCRMSGYRLGSLLQMSISDLEVAESPGETARRLADLSQTGADRFESRYRRKDGSSYDVEVSLQYVAENGGLVFAFMRDITERKKAVEDLRTSEAKFRAVVENSIDGFIFTDAEGRVLYESPSMSRINGFHAAERIGRSGFEIVQDEDRARLSEVWQQVVGHPGITQSAEYRIRRRDGVMRWVEGSAQNLLHNRDVGAIVILCRDITERKEAEVQRQKLEAQLLQAQKMEAVGRLAGGVAHDFNNMLGVILMQAELASMSLDSSHPIYTALQEIITSGHRSADLTRELLAFARRQAIEPKVVDINAAMEGLLKMLRRLIGEDIDLIWQPGKSLWSVRMDPSQLNQILANLCINSRDAIQGIGKVIIETANVELEAGGFADPFGYAPGEYVMLSVTDNGCGMDRVTRENIFEPFFTTKEKGKGTGLGLSTVFGIVKQNYGTIKVNSEIGEGTSIKVYFPRYLTSGLEEHHDSEQDSLPMGHETILLVEDEPAMLQLTAQMLEHLGYAVLAALSPGEAIRLAREHAGPIHLAITDVVMPEMNGRDLSFRLLEIFPQLRCLFMSGYTADVIAHHGVLEPGIHFIQKPYTLREMAGKIREIMENSPADSRR